MTTPPPLPRRDDNLLWLLAGVILFACVLAGTGIYVFTRYVVRDVLTVRNEVRERRLKIQTPAGSLELSQGEIPLTGLPLYPGALPSHAQGGSLSLHMPLQKGMRIDTIRYSTPDPFDMVVNFYAKRLGEAAKQSRGTNEVRFSIIAAGKQKWVLVRRVGLKTEIVLANITEASGQ